LRSTVLGAGSWGTALGAVLAGKGFPVVIWDADAGPLETIAARHENARYLPGVPLPETLRSEPDLARALEGAELVVIAVPSHAVRPVAMQARPHLREGVPVCTVAKGVEVESLMTMSEVLEDVLPVEMHPYLTFLSGPSFAIEVARGAPTAVTVAGRWDRVGKLVQDAFHTRTFRPYTSADVAGVEIGGCAKNVVAIATGLCDGLGLGANARAALITRGLAEITRLALAKGATPLTLLGLSGLGDLVLTCSSEKSRNYRVGFGLGTGRKLAEIQRELGQVAEGVVNAKSLHLLSAKLGVEMPICEAVYQILEEGQEPRAAVRALMARETRAEGF
jgi:glycerol-3-phosphate dehydrogenase (NAD(P)+)